MYLWVQVTIRQGKEPGHFLQLFNGSAVFHATSARLARGAHQQGAHHEGGMYALSGTCPDKAYAIEVSISNSRPPPRHEVVNACVYSFV